MEAFGVHLVREGYDAPEVALLAGAAFDKTTRYWDARVLFDAALRAADIQPTEEQVGASALRAWGLAALEDWSDETSVYEASRRVGFPRYPTWASYRYGDELRDLHAEVSALDLEWQDAQLKDKPAVAGQFRRAVTRLIELTEKTLTEST